MGRRAFLMAAQFAQAFAGLQVPEPAHHVVGDGGELGAIRGHGQLTKLLGVGVDGANGPIVFEVPPDQPIIVAAGDGDVALEADAGDVAAMIGAFDGRRGRLAGVDLEDLLLRTGEQQPGRVGHAGQGEIDAGAVDFTDVAQVARIGIGHGGNLQLSFSS